MENVFQIDPKLESWTHPSQHPFMEVHGAEVALTVTAHLGCTAFGILYKLLLKSQSVYLCDLKWCQFQDDFELTQLPSRHSNIPPHRLTLSEHPFTNISFEMYPSGQPLSHWYNVEFTLSETLNENIYMTWREDLELSVFLGWVCFLPT